MTEARVWIDRLRGTAVPLPRCPGLSPDEKILVAAIRLMVVDGLVAPSAAVAIALKPGSEAVLEALRNWLGRLARNTVRQIAVGAPLHCCASPDELMLLTAMEGARCGDFGLVHRILGQFVDRDDIDDLAHATEILSEQLAAAGFKLATRHLPARQRQSPD